jgi:hypothetical protein
LRCWSAKAVDAGGLADVETWLLLLLRRIAGRLLLLEGEGVLKWAWTCGLVWGAWWIGER